MDLSELRQTVLDRLQARTAEHAFAGEPELDRLINAAYVEVVNEVEAIASYWNVAETELTFTTPATAGAGEYSLSTDFSGLETGEVIRKIVDCVRNYGEIPKLVPIVPFSERRQQVGVAGSWRTVNSRPPAVAVYFIRTNTGEWRMGFVVDEPRLGTKYGVRFILDIVPLQAAGDVPSQVPNHWHLLIATRAAVVAKVQENRDPSGLAALYASDLQRMRSDLGSHTSPTRVRPL